jgi:hypothetical protein
MLHRVILDMTIPSAFKKLLPFEEKFCAELENLSNNVARKISVSPASGVDTTVRSTFLRWFLLEAIPSVAEPIAHVEIARAIFTEVANLEATTINFLLRFVECQFNEKIELSDATLRGFEMV